MKQGGFWFSKDISEVLSELSTSENGLTLNQIEEHTSKYGPNIISRAKPRSNFRIVWAQINSLLIYVLIAAAMISSFLGQFIEASVILVTIVIDVVVGFVQEEKARDIIEKLEKSVKYKVRVVRDGHLVEIDSAEIVPGDIIVFSEGDRVPCDCRLLESRGLSINEAALTGESIPISKDIEKIAQKTILAKRVNMLYAGTIVVKGKGQAVVVATGNDTELGRLASLVQKTKKERVPLEEKLDLFSKNISIVIFVLVGIVFFVGLTRGYDLYDMFLIAVSLAVSVIPEALPAIIAISLAVAIREMYKANTLIRRLPAAETLGRTTVICTDKTGTLTEEELSVEVLYAGKLNKIKDGTKLSVGEKDLLRVGILCNDAMDEIRQVIGDPTETALIKIAKLFGLSKKKETEAQPRIFEYAFDSKRKLMSIIRQNGNTRRSYVKGGAQFVLERSRKELVNGKVRVVNAKRRRELKEIYERMERDGYRVLGFGFKQVKGTTQKEAEDGLTLVGFVGMIDPPRKEVKDAIAQAREAGIDVKVITGDSALTAKAISGKLGIGGGIIEGDALVNLKDKGWSRVVRDNVIFARVTPEQKLKIVETLRKQGQIVGVTGDGVNDILALKRADVGISMGERGTDVARESSDIILLDDNFASIVSAVHQGRRVFSNLKKSTKFLLATNFADTFIIMAALFGNLPLPLLPLAILWVNLFTDSFPALALALEPAEAGIMKKKPEDGNILGDIWKPILVAGLLNFAAVMIVFMWALPAFGVDIARTMAVSIIVFYTMFFSLSCKSREVSVFKSGILNNKYLILAILFSIGMHLVAIYTVLGSVFGFVPLSGLQLGVTVVAGMVGFVVFEIGKLLRIGSTKD